MDPQKPIKPITPTGTITRGTTGINRLRRIDRWMRFHPGISRALQHAPSPLVIDLGYGAQPTTTLEMARWLRQLRPDIAVCGLEIDPERVVPPQQNVEFRLGGFELAGLRPTLVRAFNVLRQYDEAEVPAAWSHMLNHLAPDGFIVEGTCDEIGRRCCWILLNKQGPLTFTLSFDPFHTHRPSDVAERLPKSLIHHNVPGEPIHDLLAAADQCWLQSADLIPFGPRIRWRKTLQLMGSRGYPVTQLRRRMRDNTLTVPYEIVASAQQITV